jgi:hypothetical protein
MSAEFPRLAQVKISPEAIQDQRQEPGSQRAAGRLAGRCREDTFRK